MDEPIPGTHAHRYKYLDALRGVAAVFVLFYHIGTRFGGPVLALHGYIAVDFFFVLSGVVIASAYEEKIGRKFGFLEFALKRIVRLAPMAALGVVAGSAYLLLRWRINPGLSDSITGIALEVFFNLLLLPKMWWGSATHDEIFPSNGALWSLFMEMAVNLIWAACLARVSLRILVSIVIASAAVVVICSIRAGTPDIGWSLTTFVGGLGRVGYGFTMGIILFRLRGALLKATWRMAPWMALLLLAIFIFAPVTGLIWPLLGVLVGMPLAVAFGLMAGSRPILPAEDLLGRISYPLYAIHVPILMIASGAQKKLVPHVRIGLEASFLSLPIVGIAFLLLVLYDEPIRSWLGWRLLVRKKTSDGAYAAA